MTRPNIFQYDGKFNNEIRIELTELLQLIAKSNITALVQVKRLCLVAIELLDNAQRYNTTQEVSFSWKLDGTSLSISVINSAVEDDALKLKQAVDFIHGLSADRINELYKAQLRNIAFSSRGGAGLGLLQIARKGRNKIEVSIARMMDGSYLCTSSVKTNIN